ncbi:MAG: carboxypeptidase M32 [Tepidisphaeraceae bacterium]
MTDANARKAYDELVTTLREISVLGSVGSLLHWDQETQMPPRGTEHRGNQQSLIARLTHERFTSPRIGELLATLESSSLVKDVESDEAVNVRETRRSHDRAVKLPPELVEEMARTSVLAHHAWAEARKKSDYKAFEPWLAKTLDLKRKEAECVGYKESPYDALVDEYEPGETAAGLRRALDELRGPLVELVGRITSSSRKAPVEILERVYPPAAQEALAREASRAVGFDFAAGRLDTSVHPFCTELGPGDVRMTTRYDERYFGDAFFGVLHETGHGLYEQGLPPEHYGTPRAQAVSLGIHESQSRMWENLVARGRPFWRFFLPKARAAFLDTLRDVTEDQWLFAINDVRPSLIRTEADEATYNLHILLRFELEQALLLDDLKPADLPAEWNRRMKDYLGLTPPDDAKGCLQDVHWSGGAIGYFPTYTLGNMYAAQFFAQARADIPGLEDSFTHGDFRPLLDWLRTNIHQHGKRHTARQLVKKVTGRDLSPQPLLDHLRGKASDFHGV